MQVFNSIRTTARVGLTQTPQMETPSSCRRICDSKTESSFFTNTNIRRSGSSSISLFRCDELVGTPIWILKICRAIPPKIPTPTGRCSNNSPKIWVYWGSKFYKISRRTEEVCKIKIQLFSLEERHQSQDNIPPRAVKNNSKPSTIRIPQVKWFYCGTGSNDGCPQIFPHIQWPSTRWNRWRGQYIALQSLEVVLLICSQSFLRYTTA